MNAGTPNLIEGDTNAVQEQNSTTLLVTVAILAAPLAIMYWRSWKAAPVPQDSHA